MSASDVFIRVAAAAAALAFECNVFYNFKIGCVDSVTRASHSLNSSHVIQNDVAKEENTYHQHNLSHSHITS